MGDRDTAPSLALGVLQTIRAGDWRITLRVQSVEWVGDTPPRAYVETEQASREEPNVSIRELAWFLRQVTSSGRGGAQARTIERDIETGEYPELRAFKAGGAWRVPLSGIQGYARTFKLRVPSRYWRNLRTWGSFIEPPRRIP